MPIVPDLSGNNPGNPVLNQWDGTDDHNETTRELQREYYAALNLVQGKSAYQLAVENGFVGTVTQWLASLKGADGSSGDLSNYYTKTQVDTALASYVTSVSLSATLASYLTSANAASTYAPLANAALTGNPTATTQAAGNNTTRIATTAFVQQELGNYTTTASLTTLLAAKAPLASPALTGTPTAPTAAVDTNTTQVATTAYVVGQGYLKSATAATTYAPLASPALTGVPTAPTAANGTNTTQIATCAFVLANASGGTTYTAGSGITIVGSTISADTSVIATLASPALSGTPTAPTPAAANNSTRIATTAYVQTELGNYTNTTSLTTLLAAKAPLASPTFTGTPAAPTAAVDTNTTQIATTAYVVGQGYLKSATAASTYAPLASPALTGTPTAPTAAGGTNTTQIATTAFVTSAISALNLATTYAPLASPTLTGTPAAPTAAVGTNTTQIATTAYVLANAAASVTDDVNSMTGVVGTSTRHARQDHQHAYPKANINSQTGTTYTLVDTDHGKTVELSNAAAITVTVPTGLGVGFNCGIYQAGAGQITVVAGSGNTLRNRSGHTKSAGQYAELSIRIRTTAEFVLAGDTSA